MTNLAPEAVEAFLNRPRADWRIYKTLSTQRLDAIAKRNRINSQLWATLRKHQKIMLLVCLRAGRFALWADTGTGKTVTMIATAQELLRRGKVAQTLVLVPRKANKDEWRDEVRKHAPDLDICVLPSRIEEKWWTLERTGAPLVVETYSGLHNLCCDKVRHKRGKNKLQPSRTKVRWLGHMFQGLVLDESHHAKTKNKLPFRLCRALSKSAQYVYALSGTPHGRDPTDLWGQMMIVDGGKTLGETLGLFRAAFFREQKDLYNGTQYVFAKRTAPLLNRILANGSIRFKAQESDLPKLVPIIKTAHLPTSAEAYYAKAREAILAAGNKREMRNAWLRMRQISSGFVGYHDDDAGTKAQFEFPENPKLDLLLSLLEGIQGKALVYYEYTYSGLRIVRELKKLGINALHMYGGSKDQQRVREMYLHDKRYPVLVLQNQFGEGLNLQVAQYGLFYESPVSPIVRRQCVGRFERQHSQHRHVFQYDLVCTGTVDEHVLEALKEGRDLFQAVIDGKARLD